MIRNIFICLVVFIAFDKANAWEVYPIDSTAVKIEAIDGNCYIFGGKQQLLRYVNKQEWYNIGRDVLGTKESINTIFKYHGSTYVIAPNQAQTTPTGMSSRLLTIADDTLANLWALPSEYSMMRHAVIDDSLYLLGYTLGGLESTILKCSPADSNVELWSEIPVIGAVTGFVRTLDNNYWISCTRYLYKMNYEQTSLSEEYQTNSTIFMAQLDQDNLFIYAKNGVLRKYDHKVQMWTFVYIDNAWNSQNWSVNKIIKTNNTVLLIANDKDNHGALFSYRPDEYRFELVRAFDTLTHSMTVFNDELLVLGAGKLYSTSLDSLTADVAEESLSVWKIRGDRIEIPEELCTAGYTANVYDISGKLISSKFYNKSEFDASEYSNYNMLIIEIIAANAQRQFKCINGQISTN